MRAPLTLTPAGRLVTITLVVMCGARVDAQQHATGAAADVLALEQQIEEAIVRGDVA